MNSLSFPCFVSLVVQRECGGQFHENLDNHLIHGFCRRNLVIGLEAVEEVSDHPQ